MILKPIERVSTTLQLKEPDKVPVFLFFTIQGAGIKGMSIQEYYNTPEAVADAQIHLQNEYQHDCLYSFYYAGKEYEAFGGESRIQTHGPPESGKPVFTAAEDILSLELPSPSCKELEPIIHTQKLLFEKKGDELPIINAVIAPLSLPVMLLGFEKWIDTIVSDRELAKDVVEHLSEFTIGLSNYMFENGATALAYFNPLAAPHMMFQKDYEFISFPTCKKYFKSIKGAAVYAFAGGKCTDLLNLVVDDIGVPGVVISSSDDLGEVKKQVGSKTNLLGNLDNISMTHWTKEKTESEIIRCTKEAAAGGGYIITDHHGELPLGVDSKTLHGIIAARDRWGTY
ncbi:MAG: uroporphyrinogen decarboxylase family protein [Candidatus Thorarchaeota archaeon]